MKGVGGVDFVVCMAGGGVEGGLWMSWYLFYGKRCVL